MLWPTSERLPVLGQLDASRHGMTLLNECYPDHEQSSDNRRRMGRLRRPRDCTRVYGGRVYLERRRFACACIRRSCHLLPADGYEDWREAVEKHADGLLNWNIC